MTKKNESTETSAPKAGIRRKVLIWTGTALGIAIAYALLSKTNASDPNSDVYEAEAKEIINESKASAE